VNHAAALCIESGKTLIVVHVERRLPQRLKPTYLLLLEYGTTEVVPLVQAGLFPIAARFFKRRSVSRSKSALFFQKRYQTPNIGSEVAAQVRDARSDWLKSGWR
jgi:hypothetical protein